MIFGDGAQLAAAQDVSAAVAHAGNGDVVGTGFEGRDQGGAHAFEARIAGGFSENALVGFFDGAQQRGGIAIRRLREVVGHAIDGNAGGAFAAAGAAHTVGEQIQTQFRDDAEKVLIVGAYLTGSVSA